MKDIETLLQSGSSKPQRPLRANFTKNVTSYLVEHPKQSWVARLTENNMKWFTKPAIALSALAIVVLAGGTGYAAIGGWPGVVALFGGQETLSNGDRIVKVDTKNCNYITAFSVTQETKAQNELYYRVKNGSKLTNEQVVELVRGNCFAEEQAKFDMSVVQTALQANPLNKDRVVGGYADSVVTAITTTSISLEYVLPVGSELKTVKQTFNNIAPDVLVYQSPSKLTWGDIKVGDHVSFSYRASGDALNKSETTPPSAINPDEQVIVVINKNTPEYSTAMQYQKYNLSEFEQVVPCQNTADGYCNYEQFYNK